MATTEDQTLASLDSSTFAIDPSLTTTDTELFLSQLKQDTSQDINNDRGLDDATVTAIKQSLSEAQAHADRQARQELEDGNALAGSSKDLGILGTESNPITHPTIHTAPFSKPDRDDSTPYPEHYAFASKVEFEEWFDGEKSWCHFVQRRTTTPQQRAEDRMKARMKAYERALLEMPRDQAVHAAPLKTRKRNHTTPVHMKITFTCHHAGKYSASHSENLPPRKLRLNTKQSVKCKCTARIVFTEMHSGECQAIYYWKHEGHDLFSQTEHQSGRLPAIIDNWLVKQIEAGKDTDDIRKMLSIPENEKQAYVKRVTEDPSLIDPDMPPALAFQVKIKYPDIYNRYRKLRGPIRSVKAPKSRSKRQKLSHSVEDQSGDMSHHQSVSMAQQFGLDTDADIPTGYDLSELAKDQHSDLAKALMSLPSGPGGADGGEEGEGGENGDEDAQELDQQVLDMARIAAERGEGEGVTSEEIGPVEGLDGEVHDQRDEIGSVDWNAFAV